MPDLLELRRNIAHMTLDTDEGEIHIRYRPGVARSSAALELEGLGDELQAAGETNTSPAVRKLFAKVRAFMPRLIMSWDFREDPDDPESPIVELSDEGLLYQDMMALIRIFSAVLSEAMSGPKSTPEPRQNGSRGSGGARTRTKHSATSRAG